MLLAGWVQAFLFADTVAPSLDLYLSAPGVELQ